MLVGGEEQLTLRDCNQIGHYRHPKGCRFFM